MKISDDKARKAYAGDARVGAYLTHHTDHALKCFARAPAVPRLEERILAKIDRLNMSYWHYESDGAARYSLSEMGDANHCGTTHCLAGWATYLAGDAGIALEKEFGPHLAGAAIFAKSTGNVPDFMASDKAAKDALKKRCARRAARKAAK